MLLQRRQFLAILGGAVAAVGIPLPALAEGLSARQLAMRRAARHWGLTIAQARQRFISYRSLWAGWIRLAHEGTICLPSTINVCEMAKQIRQGEAVWGLAPIELP